MKNKLKYIIPSIITLLPMFFGMLVWDKLPEKIPTHFGLNGEADGFSGKFGAVFSFPLIFFLIYWLLVFVETKIGKAENNKKMQNLVLYIIPFISLIINGCIYTIALGKEVKIELVFSVFFSIMFIVIGNYLPKCKQSKTVGIKLPWTLKSEENWNATHRLAGKVWVSCGFVWLIFGLLFPQGIVCSPIIIFIAVIIPTIYSYLYSKKEK